ncbi:hypothetical protein [Calothrix sp. 336/3]|nr:hypothetical protein [Calothrix sp. 336/3]
MQETPLSSVPTPSQQSATVTNVQLATLTVTDVNNVILLTVKLNGSSVYT